MRVRARVFAVAVSLLFGCGALAQSPGQTENKTTDVQRLSAYRDATVLLERARGLYEKKDLAGARAVAGECLGKAPTLSDGHFLLAKISYLEKDYAKALEEVEAAEKGWDETAAVLERLQADRLTKLRGRLREKDESIAYLQGELARSPGQQAVIQPQITKLQNDKREIERILQETPATGAPLPAEYRYVHGNILLKLKRPGEAAAEYGEALRLKPGTSEAANNLASLLYGARRYAEARSVLQSAESAGATLNPELKLAVEKALSASPAADASGESGTLVVTVTKPWPRGGITEVFVDGRPVGRLVNAGSLSVPLPAGLHTVRFRRDSQSTSHGITIRSGETTSLIDPLGTTDPAYTEPLRPPYPG